MDPKNAQFISIFHGWKMFQPNLKSKLLHPFSIATLLLKHVSFFQPRLKKDVLLAHYHNNIIYQFVCHCDSWYLGRTSQRLQECIKQHVSRSIRNHHSSQDRSNLSCACKKNSTSQIIAHDSAIGQNVLKNPFYASQCSDAKFSILPQGRTFFHLSTLKLHLSNLFNLISVDTRNFFSI